VIRVVPRRIEPFATARSGFHPTFTPGATRPPGEGGERRANGEERPVQPFVTNHAATSFSDDPQGLRPEGGVYGGSYLPTYPFLSSSGRHGSSNANTRARNRYRPSTRRRRRRRGEVASLASRELRDLAFSHGTRVFRAHSSHPLLRGGRLLRRLTRRLYDVALTCNRVLCTRELDVAVEQMGKGRRKKKGRQREKTGRLLHATEFRLALCEF